MAGRTASGRFCPQPGAEIHRNDPEVQSGVARENSEHARNKYRNPLSETRPQTPPQSPDVARNYYPPAAADTGCRRIGTLCAFLTGAREMRVRHSASLQFTSSSFRVLIW